MNKNKFITHLSKFFGTVLVLTLIFVLVSGSTGIKADENEVRLNVSEVSIVKDGVFRLRAYNVPQNARIIYRSSDTSVAFVDSRGYITGISNGDCVVTATIVTGNTASQTLKCSVTVGPAAISIKLTRSELVLSVGMKKTLKTIVSPLNTVENPVFYSSDKEIASVTSIGRVKAKGIGEAVIFAFLLNGESAECQVYVLSEEDYELYLEAGTLEGIIEDYVSIVDTEFPDDTVEEKEPEGEQPTGVEKE